MTESVLNKQYEISEEISKTHDQDVTLKGNDEMITCTDDAVLQRNIKLKETTRELDLTKGRFQKKIAEITTYYETLILQKENEH